MMIILLWGHYKEGQPVCWIPRTAATEALFCAVGQEGRKLVAALGYLCYPYTCFGLVWFGYSVSLHHNDVFGLLVLQGGQETSHNSWETIMRRTCDFRLHISDFSHATYNNNKMMQGLYDKYLASEKNIFTRKINFITFQFDTIGKTVFYLW